MILKILGIIIVVSSCSLIGLCIKMQNIQHVKDLENLCQCFDIINNQMTYSLKNFKDSFIKACDYANENNKKIFKKIIDDYDKSNGESISQIWNKNINLSLISSSLYNKEDLDSIRIFGNLLGTGDLSTQSENINKSKNSIAQRIDAAQKYNIKTSVFTKLGVYAGLIIVILLI